MASLHNSENNSRTDKDPLQYEFDPPVDRKRRQRCPEGCKAEQTLGGTSLAIEITTNSTLGGALLTEGGRYGKTFLILASVGLPLSRSDVWKDSASWEEHPHSIRQPLLEFFFQQTQALLKGVRSFEYCFI